MIKIKFINFILFVLIIFLLTAAGFYKAFAFNMKSKNYHLDLEASNIQSIPQDFISDFGNKFKNNISQRDSNNKNKKLKAGAIGAFLLFLTIFILKRNKKIKEIN